MCDPIKRPLKWNKKFYVYAERHGLYDVAQALMKELVIWRPVDPIRYIRNEIRRIGKSVYSPQVFMLGPAPLTPLLAEGIANHCGAKYFTLQSIINSTTDDIKGHLKPFYDGENYDHDEPRMKLLITAVQRRLVASDCLTPGYVIYGFPQTRAQAVMAQSCGLLPRQVFVLLPKGPVEERNTAASLVTPGSAGTNPFGFLDIFDNNMLKRNYTNSQMNVWKEYFAIKDVAKAYSKDTLRVHDYDHWNSMDPHDLEAEFLGVLITKPNTGAPWVPRILIMGPPGVGKRTVAEKLAEKYNLMAVGWMDLIRGALAFNDDTSDECKAYLHDFAPLSDQCVANLLKRRFYRDESILKGYIFYGFPETANQAGVMDQLSLTPNRIFLLSCPETTYLERIQSKKEIIMSRTLPNHPVFYKNPKVLEASGETGEKQGEGFGFNCYTDAAIKARVEQFKNNQEGIHRHFGSSTIYVDASETADAVLDFVLTCVIRPPTVNFE